jgi:hypothetical protein
MQTAYLQMRDTFHNLTFLQRAFDRSITAYDKAIIALKLTLRHIHDIIESVKDEHWLINIGSIFERFFILGGPRGTRYKKLQKLDSIQSEGGPKDAILLEALNGRFQFEKRHRQLKKVLKCKFMWAH